MVDGREPSLLVVEDEEALAQGLVFNLERKRYRVEVATDGEQALSFLERGRFDLVVLDVRLPEMDGFEVCTELRRRNDFTPVLMLTARSQPDDVVYGLKCGADDYVVKPFDLAELLARVEVLLRRKQWTEGSGPRAPVDASSRGSSLVTIGSTFPRGRQRREWEWWSCLRKRWRL